MHLLRNLSSRAPGARIAVGQSASTASRRRDTGQLPAAPASGEQHATTRLVASDRSIDRGRTDRRHSPAECDAEHRLYPGRRSRLEGRRLQRLGHQDAEHRSPRGNRPQTRTVLRAADVHAHTRGAADRPIPDAIRAADTRHPSGPDLRAADHRAHCFRRHSARQATARRLSANGISATPSANIGRVSAASIITTVR